MKKILSVVLSIVMVISLIPVYAVPAIAEGETQHEPVFSVEVSGNTFTITRSESWKQQTVAYRTVSVTAVEGIHFTAAQGTLTFNVGESSKTVTVTETAVGDIPVRYRYQTGTYREYRLEVLDNYGFLLASGTRKISYGDSYKFNNAYVNSSVSTLLLNNGYSETASTTDVTYSPSNNTFIQVTHAGYNQAVHSISTNSLFSQSGIAPREYLSAIGDKLYAAVRFQVKEENDGYQYIQILADNSSTYDGNDPDGNVNTPSISYYKACFERDKSTTANSEAESMAFPHRYDYKSRYEENNAGITDSHFASYDNYLYAQKYRNDSVRTANSGAIVLDPTTQEINVRFDAAGSGSDTWDFRNLRARFAIGDETAPFAVDQLYVSRNSANLKHSPVTITICFNEIVKPTNCVLKTTWGDFPVISTGSYANVLSFSGAITANQGTQLKITGIEGTVSDLFNRNMQGNISKTLSYTVGQSPTVPSSGGVYLISNAAELYAYADMLESYPNRSGRLMNDIDMSNSDAAGFKAMGGANGFTGTFDGSGHKIINLNNVSAAANGLCGLFGFISAGGRVQNLDLEIAFTAPLGSSGAICGLNLGTVENCTVSGKIYNSIDDSAQSSASNRFGGVVGDNRGNVIHCLALNEIWNTWQNLKAGGIVGYNSGTVESCCFNGAFSSRYDVTRGAVCGENANIGTIINCAARNINSNYYSYAIGANNGTATNTLYMSTSDFTSGKACYEVLNNGVSDGTQFWYQNIDNENPHDDCPQFSGGTVYKHGNIYTNTIVHTLSHVDAVVPRCETVGYGEYWRCTVDGCGKIFADENAQNETTLEAVTIPALGHDWQTDWNWGSNTHWHYCSRCNEKKDEAPHSFDSAPTWYWNGIYKARARFECSVCNSGINKGANITYSVSGNLITATATVSFNGNTYTDTNTETGLTLGENTADIVANKSTYYCFVPSEDNFYRFESTGDYDPKINIYDESGNRIAYDDGGGEDDNFLLVTFLEAGKLYTIEFSSDDGTGDLTVFISKEYSYAITVDSAIEHGRVWVEDGNGNELTLAPSGQKLYIRQEPDSGYCLKSVTVTDSSGNPVDLDGSFGFIMPESDITVSAQFGSNALSVGENTVYIQRNTSQTYSFTPSQGGDYKFYSVGNYDPEITVKDDGGATIGTNDDYDFSLDNGNFNFNLTVFLEAGKTYTVEIFSYVYYDYKIGFMTMFIEKAGLQYDINSDGFEDINDIGFILSASVGNIEMNWVQALKADLNNDGVVDGFDAAWLDRYY